jgi:hypothetical protein
MEMNNNPNGTTPSGNYMSVITMPNSIELTPVVDSKTKDNRMENRP